VRVVGVMGWSRRSQSSAGEGGRWRLHCVRGVFHGCRQRAFRATAGGTPLPTWTAYA